MIHDATVHISTRSIDTSQAWSNRHQSSSAVLQAQGFNVIEMRLHVIRKHPPCRRWWKGLDGDSAWLSGLKWRDPETTSSNYSMIYNTYIYIYTCIPYTVYVAIAKTSWTWRNNSIEHPWGSMSLLLLFPIHHHLGHAIMINSIMLPKNAKDTNVMIEGREGILTVHNHASHRNSILYQEAYRCL